MVEMREQEEIEGWWGPSRVLRKRSVCDGTQSPLPSRTSDTTNIVIQSREFKTITVA